MTLLNRALKPIVEDFRRAVGLPRFNDLMDEVLLSRELNILGWSRALCAAQSDWPPRHRLAGFLNIPPDTESAGISPEMARFIGRGEPPVYMTLGASEQLAPAEYAALLAAAARKAGVRAVIQTTWKNPPPPSERILFARRNPHEAVFPRCAAILHHGGAGTTHTALRCGRPAVVAYFMDEQCDWGRTLHRLGAAARPVSIKRATPARLARRLRDVLDSPAMAARAAALAERMHGGDGPGRAVGFIEEFAEEKGLT